MYGLRCTAKQSKSPDGGGRCTVYGVQCAVHWEKEQKTVNTKREEEFQFDFEKLEVYGLALEFLSKLFKIYKSLPKDLQYALGNNLIRAGVSISNNLAEGSGKKSKKHKLSYYNISLDSTRECISMNNVLLKEKLIDKETYMQIRSEGKRITSMIIGLIKSLGLDDR